ncbi:MAG TPA: hypothetical protein VHL11_20505 [Phototrophicaceae bacterium]|jgi:hypothetical protein|nr:hypothetical protein [Phototrophicaceae bacterium]
MFRIGILMICTMILLCSCNLSPTELLGEATITASPLEGHTPEATPLSGWTDEINIMSGICFESAYDAKEITFVIHNDNELSTFFNLADNSDLCRHPVERQVFDFSNGRILAGLWSYGHGCKAHHDVLSIDRDDTAKKLTMHLKFVIEGDCDYELIRPFWAGLQGVSDYEIKIEVEQ